jgi:hypothetical protein
MFAARFLRESHDFKAHAESGHVRRRSKDAVWEVLRHSSEPAPRLIWIYAIAMGAFPSSCWRSAWRPSR